MPYEFSQQYLLHDTQTISSARTALSSNQTLANLTDFRKNIHNVSLTALLLVIVVSDPDDVVKDVFTEDVYQFIAVLRRIPHIIHGYNFLQLPRGNEGTKEVWKRTTVICRTDVFRKFPTN